MRKDLLIIVSLVALACGLVPSAQAYTYYCAYGTPPVGIPPSYSTLYCRADVDSGDLHDGTHLQMVSGAAALSQNQYIVAGTLNKLYQYTTYPRKYVHYVRRGPDMPERTYWLGTVWEGLNIGQPTTTTYQGPNEGAVSHVMAAP